MYKMHADKKGCKSKVGKLSPNYYVQKSSAWLWASDKVQKDKKAIPASNKVDGYNVVILGEKGKERSFLVISSFTAPLGEVAGKPAKERTSRLVIDICTRNLFLVRTERFPRTACLWDGKGKIPKDSIVVVLVGSAYFQIEPKPIKIVW